MAVVDCDDCGGSPPVSVPEIVLWLAGNEAAVVVGKTTEPVNPEAVWIGTEIPPASHNPTYWLRIFCAIAMTV